LWALALVPVALLAYLLTQRNRPRRVARFANPALLPNLAPRSPGWRRHVPAAFYVLALAGLLLSLARPQAVMAVPREQATVVMVMDTSASMVATDVQPSRYAAANAAAKRFLDSLPPSFRVALVSFNANAQLVTAPTVDRAAVRDALDTLKPEAGTAMGDALDLARGVVVSVSESAQGAQSAQGVQPAFGPGASSAVPEGPPPAAILLLSDGAQTAGQIQPTDAAERIRQLGVPVYSIALGTSAGVIDSPDNPGTPLPVPPDPDTLQQIAQATGGQFFTAPTASDLQAVYENISSRVTYAQEPQEVTHAFAAAGALLLAAGSVLALLWFNRFP
jgi:Ca-activated chloride channel family protein